MINKEWPLVINSIMLQIAVGAIMMVAVFRSFILSDMDGDAAISLTTVMLFCVGPIIVMGVTASFFHLGSPTRAFRALTNLKRSWLSREILFTNVFLGLWAMTYAMEFLNIKNELFLWLSVGAGFVALWCMANIYYSTKRRGWYSMNTFVGFFGSTVLFGSVVMAIQFFVNGNEMMGGSWIILFSLLGVLILALRMKLELNLIPSLTSQPSLSSFNSLACASKNVQNIAPLYRKLTVGGLICSIFGAILLLGFLLLGVESIGLFFIIVTALLICVGEWASRSGFYCLAP